MHLILLNYGFNYCYMYFFHVSFYVNVNAYKSVHLHTHTHTHTHTHVRAHTHTQSHTHNHWGKHPEEDVTFTVSTDSMKTISTSRFGLVELYSINAIPANKRDDYLKQLLSVRMNILVETSAHPTSNQATESCGVLVLNRNLGIVASLNTFASVLCWSVGLCVHCMLLLPLSVL